MVKPSSTPKQETTQINFRLSNEWMPYAEALARSRGFSSVSKFAAHLLLNEMASNPDEMKAIMAARVAAVQAEIERFDTDMVRCREMLGATPGIPPAETAS